MSSENIRGPAERLEILFQSLRKILEGERERNWLCGVEACLALLSAGRESTYEELVEQVLEVASTFRSMVAGYGSFSDFHIWCDGYDERIRANEELDGIRLELWEIVRKVQDLDSQR